MSQLSSDQMMTYTGQTPYTAGRIIIGSISDGAYANIDNSILNVSVDYSMNEASQLSFDVVESVSRDYSKITASEKQFVSTLDYASNNYFLIGRDVIYETTTLSGIDRQGVGGGQAVRVQQLFEIANVSISQGPGGSPIWSVKCFTKAIQQMKRDRKFSSIKGSGTSFVKRAAEQYGLRFWGQETNKKVSITKASGDNQADSLWDVIKKIAGEAKFVVYEVDGILIFASEDYLMYRWGLDSDQTVRVVNKQTKKPENRKAKFVPLQYPYVTVGKAGYFYATQYPTIEVSDNDPRYGSGSIIIERDNGTQLRPGMTAYVGNVPNLSGYYLIDTVSFSDRTPDPVTVTFRKPTKEPKDIKDLQIGQRFLATGVAGSLPTIVSSKNGTQPRQSSFPAQIIPLPTQAAQYNYPRQTGLTVQGNIPLYDRPVLNINGKSESIYPFVIFQKSDLSISTKNFATGDTAVILARVWTSGGVPTQYTDAQAKTKYLSDGLHLGKFSTDTAANRYLQLLTRQQDEVLKKRFPNVDLKSGALYPNTAGST